jgi:hypothetical protein
VDEALSVTVLVVTCSLLWPALVKVFSFIRMLPAKGGFVRLLRLKEREATASLLISPRAVESLRVTRRLVEFRI